MYKDNSLISNKNGITLIVLVITIILLIILAGVVLVSLTGENGIITKAKEAAKKYENVQNLENEILEGYQNFENSDYDNTNNNIGSYSVGQEIDIDSLKDYGLHICDGSILNLSDYPNLGKSRSDLITHSIDKSPIFSSPNSRVTCMERK